MKSSFRLCKRGGTKGKGNEKKNWKKNHEKKIWEKKYFKTKILTTKVYNNINKCDTIFALLAPLYRNKEKHKE